MPERKSSNVVLQRKGVDPLARTSWSEQHAWLAEHLERFHVIFRPVVKALNAAAEEEPLNKSPVQL